MPQITRDKGNLSLASDVQFSVRISIIRGNDALVGDSKSLQRSEHDDADTGHSLCAATTAEDAGIHDYGAADAGVGNWRECRDLYAGECCAAKEPTGRRSDDAGAAGRQQRLLRGWRDQK